VAEQLIAALVAACAELGDVPKKHKASVPTKSGGSYSYDYADLADTLQCVRPVLAKHGLAVLQPVTTDPEHELVVVTTVIIHTSGERLDLGALGLPLGQGAQATGSAVTYARRYALTAALGLAAEDDDGAAATARPAQRSSGAHKPVQRAQERPQARTTQEAQILELLSLMPDDTKRDVVTKFKDHFGCGLSVLPVGSHVEALDFVMNAMQEDNG
jgi:hypothetical protein